MKKVLITGINSYIGNAIESWLLIEKENYSVDKISLKSDDWKVKDFSIYDVLLHIAGIAHVSTDPKLEDLYFKVNRDLTSDIALKAKTEGVKQFIFMSSMIVYGKKQHSISLDTLPTPDNFYGLSKLQAEQKLKELETNVFKISIVRPPMIYGRDSKGNYPRLSKLSQFVPVFPDFPNKRSMLHIDNLCEFIKLVIDHEDSGLFFPQNKEYVNTSLMVKIIAKQYNHKIYFTKIFNPLIDIFKNINIVSKIFGNFYYNQDISGYSNGKYQIRTFEESIQLTEVHHG